MTRFSPTKTASISSRKQSTTTRGRGVKVPDLPSAEHLRARLHQCRVLDRRQNRRIYDADHVMHGCSAFDEIKVRIRQTSSGLYVYLERVKLSAEDLEILSEVNEEAMPVQIQGPRPVEMVQQLLDQRKVLMIEPPESFKRRV